MGPITPKQCWRSRCAQSCGIRETMRPNEDFAVVADNNDLAKRYNSNNNYYNYNNNNNNNSYNGSTSSSSNSSAIPYHARENSLPFSYGQIGKTSTPLRKTSMPSESAGGSYLDYVGATTTRTATDLQQSPVNESNGNGMIKTQPRLKSPLLVRKTLGGGGVSHSPTRNTSSSSATANTIANTYHYNYKNSGSNGYNGVGTTTSPRRDDFEQLLRERREKVYNEYSSRLPPEPPQRQHSHLATRLTNGSGSGYQNGSSRSKYNYDFEFNLNLDDLDLGLDRQRLGDVYGRPHTLERSSLQAPLPYQTHDIVDAAVAPKPTYLERNYHTISSRETSSSTAATKTTAPTYGERPPLEVAYNRRQQRVAETQTQYGNGNPALYGNNNSSYNNNNNYINYNNSGYNTIDSSSQSYNEYGYRGSAPTPRAARRDLSPIYATTTKQQLQQQRSIQSGSISSGGGGGGGGAGGINTTTTSSTTITSNRSNELDYPTTPHALRPETPAFPVTPGTPYGMQNGLYSPQIRTHTPTSSPGGGDIQNYTSETIYQSGVNGAGTLRPRLNSSLSHASNAEPQEVAAQLVKFARNSEKFWYKPNLSREDAIALLIQAPPGTFIVRDSTTYKNAYGLVVRVAQPPPGSSTNEPQELVRHFLIEPTKRGVRLKGCANEPIFTCLPAFVYGHSINQLALPCLLRIPEEDIVQPLVSQTPAQQQLLTHGAATNVLWLFSCETESLTGEEAIRKAIRQMYAQRPLPTPTEVHFKVTQQGITLTDNTRKKFFRKHYGADIISFCAVDPDNRLWTMQEEGAEEGKQSALGALKKTIFAFVARRSPSSKDNQCHVFCDLTISQPASAIVSFANKTLPTEKQRNYVL